MGRFIGIGIHYRTEIYENATKWNREEFFRLCPPSLFDYSSFKESGVIELAPEIPGDAIAELRRSVLEICDLPCEQGKDALNLENVLHDVLKRSRMEDLKSVARELHFNTFQDYEHPWGFSIGDELVPIRNHYFLIYLSFFKFYPKERTSYHEINAKLERLVYYSLASNRYRSLVHSFITL